jgi:hypothetical protein
MTSSTQLGRSQELSSMAQQILREYVWSLNVAK